MKNPLTQFSIAIIAFIALTFLMSYTRASAEEAKQYIVVYKSGGFGNTSPDKFEQEINQKLQEGWRVQGGVGIAPNGFYQALVK
ncbi:MAG: hypothetical protein JWO06_1475 [Bacteroidota bacterium]|nr:hypothetical protein [Bacteroidota bacterium]